MNRFLAVLSVVIVLVGLSGSAAAQVDEEDCPELPNLDSVTKCEWGFFTLGDEDLTDISEPKLAVVIRVEYKSEKIANKSFCEVLELNQSTDKDDIPLKPTKDYRKIGIGDALSGEDEDGSIVVVLRDDRAIILISANVVDELDDLIEAVVDEDAIPKEVEGWQSFRD